MMPPEYRGWRYRTRIVVPPSPALTVGAFLVVMGLLVAGMVQTAGGVVLVYILAGYGAGRLPTASLYLYAQVMFGVCMGAAMLRHQDVAVAVYVACGLAAAGAAWVVTRRRTRRAF